MTISLDQILAHSTVGANKAVQKLVEGGMAEPEARRMVLERVSRLYEAVGAGEIDLSAAVAGKGKEEKSPRDALLEEIRETAAGFVHSKWSGKKTDFIITEQYIGRKADRRINALVSQDQYTLYTNYRKYFPGKKNSPPDFVIPAVKKVDDEFSLFCFESRCYVPGTNVENKDGWGRSYAHFVGVLMPQATGDKLADFILREDPNIIFDVYRALFPKNAAVNEIKLRRDMSIVIDDKTYAVPSFTPEIPFDR